MTNQVVALVGVNGVGKTSIARQIVEQRPEIVVANLAELMMKELGLTSRSELSGVSRDDRALARIEGVQRAIEESDGPLILDTHMMLPDNSVEGGFREVWPHDITQLIDMPVLVLAHEQSIAARRISRELRDGGGRTLSNDPNDILLEQMCERRLFRDVFGDTRSLEVDNVQGALPRSVERVSSVIYTPLRIESDGLVPPLGLTMSYAQRR